MAAIAVPSLISSFHWEASVSGVNASTPLSSDDQTSVYPRPDRERTISRCSASGRLGSGRVIPQRGSRVIVPPASAVQAQISQLGRFRAYRVLDSAPVTVTGR